MHVDVVYNHSVGVLSEKLHNDAQSHKNFMVALGLSKAIILLKVAPFISK
jgi:hypothetical protein